MNMSTNDDLEIDEKVVNAIDTDLSQFVKKRASFLTLNRYGDNNKISD